jgi:hypothetical protein
MTPRRQIEKFGVGFGYADFNRKTALATVGDYIAISMTYVFAVLF